MKKIIKAIKGKGVPFQHVPLLIAGIIFCAVVFCPRFVFAAGSISISGGTWALGTQRAQIESTSPANNWTVTNDSGGTEDVNIKVSSTGTWTASTDGTQSAIDTFVLRKDSSTGTIITATDQTLVSSLANAGTSSFGLYFETPISGSEQGAHTLTITLTATNWVFVCGNTLTINHTAGTVSPFTVTISYGTVTSSLSGASKCWITQNLGATQQATSATDSTEASGGWYWQFNRIQGYKYDTARTPSAWDSTTDSTYTGWDPAKDPCTLLLGTGWRLPTSTEWTNVDSTGAWNNRNDTYNSVLKLHAAGYLYDGDGVLDLGGSNGFYWGSTQFSSTSGYDLAFYSSFSYLFGHSKAYGFSVRCLNP